MATLLVAAIILPNQFKAQSCPWAKTAGGVNEDFGAAVATDSKGNVYYLGNFYSQSANFGGSPTLHNQAYAAGNYGSEIFLVKYDSCGTFIWAKQAGGKNDAHGTCITTDDSGYVYIGGYSNCDTLFLGTTKLINVGGSSNAFVAKYNSSGIAQWVKGGGGNAQNYLQAIALDGSKNIYVTGSFNSDTLTFGSTILKNGYSGNNGDIFTAKFDNNGNIQWLQGGEGNGVDVGYGIGTDAAGNVYVAGTFGSPYIRFGTDSVANSGYNDIFVVKYNTSGAVQWLKGAGAPDDDQALGLASDATGNVYITGHIGSSATPVTFGTGVSLTNSVTNSLTMFIAKYDNTGAALWARSGKPNGYTLNMGYGIKLDAGGNPNVIGFFGSDSLNLGAVSVYNSSLTSGTSGNDSTDIFVAKYKSNGNVSWVRSAGGTGHDYGYAIATGPNNSLYITGEFDSPTISFAGSATYSLTPGSLPLNGDAFICNNISTLPVTPNICLVSADSINAVNEYNVVYWDKAPYTTASNFIIYREVTSGSYKKIGSQPYSALSRFIDTVRSIGPANGDPMVSTYRYKIQFMDTSGTYSYMSPYHNTVYFQHNSSGNFSWNLYTVGNPTVTPVSNYYLMRDDNSTGSWHSIGSTTGTQTNLTDPNYTTYSVTANWRVDADTFNCTPTFRYGVNSGQAAIIKSKSNISNNRGGFGINNVINSSALNIYPNPAKGSFVIETTLTEKQNVQVIDVNGKIVLNQTINGTTAIDAGALNEGVYNINITNRSNVVNKRLVIVK